MAEESKKGDFRFLLGFFIGGLVGAVVIFFLGTKEGKKLRRELSEKGQDTLDDVQDKLSELEEKGKELVEQGEAIKEKVVAEVEDKKDELTKQAVVKIDDALAHIEELQERGRETTASLRKRLFKNIPKKS